MSFIDASYFVGDINIPNTGSSAIAERVTLFISKYEPVFLQKLMGYPLYKAFSAVAPPTDQRLLDILNGKEYTDYQGRLQKWRGLVNADLPESCIAYYVYYWYRSSNATQTTDFGEVITQAENSRNASPRKKLAGAWYKLHDRVKQFCEFMEATQIADPTIYPEWTLADEHHALKEFAFMNPIF
jgi:hypothetical protein